MDQTRIRHMFPGGNTSQGFHSFYNYIISQEEAVHIMVIKGGPGVGKSTFMKKVGNEMLERGYDIELMHCSSDNNSLDGLVIPEAHIALIDGTSPHIVDPKNPGAVDEIINLGDFWDEDGIRVHRESILKANKQTGQNFARAYRYLNAAASVYGDIAAITGAAVDNKRVSAVGARLSYELFGTRYTKNREGRERCLFASAITPNGLKNFLDSILTAGEVYELTGAPGTGTERVLQKVRDTAIEKGYNVESYYCALLPNKLEHLVIPDLDVSLTTSNEYHASTVEKIERIDLNTYVEKSEVENYIEELSEGKELLDKLLNVAVSSIGKAKTIHDRLETYYIPNMDFEAVQRCFESTMSRILGYIEN